MPLEDEEGSYFEDAAASTHLGSDFKSSPVGSTFGCSNQVKPHHYFLRSIGENKNAQTILN